MPMPSGIFKAASDLNEAVIAYREEVDDPTPLAFTTIRSALKIAELADKLTGLIVEEANK